MVATSIGMLQRKEFYQHFEIKKTGKNRSFLDG
jgi:hypothetical protein